MARSRASTTCRRSHESRDTARIRPSQPGGAPRALYKPTDAGPPGSVPGDARTRDAEYGHDRPGDGRLAGDARHARTRPSPRTTGRLEAGARAGQGQGSRTPQSEAALPG